MKNLWEVDETSEKDYEDVSEIETGNDINEEFSVEEDVDMDVLIFRMCDLRLETIELKLSMIFENVKVMRNTIKLYGLRHGKHMKYKRNEKERIHMCCNNVGCHWELFSRK